MPMAVIYDFAYASALKAADEEHPAPVTCVMADERVCPMPGELLRSFRDRLATGSVRGIEISTLDIRDKVYLLRCALVSTGILSACMILSSMF